MTNREALAPQSRLPSLQRSWQEKLHRGRSKLPQVEVTDCPAMIAMQRGCSFGKPFFNLRSS
jgi:hypothetical protein